jgi:hypothetical protein
MKTKLQAIAGIIAVVAFSQVTKASKESRINAILGENKLTMVNPMNTFDISYTTTNDLIKGKTGVNVTDNIANITGHYHGGGGLKGPISGKNVVYAGVGFVSILGVLASSISFGNSLVGIPVNISSIPAITVAYERGLSEHWGVGLRFDYQSITASKSGIIDNTSGIYPKNVGQKYSYNDNIILTGLTFVATGGYHFRVGERVDPYVGLALGYTSIGVGYSTTDPNAGTGANQDGNANSAPTISFGGFTLGGYLGIRIYFISALGVWADVGYIGAGSTIINLGLVIKF